MNGTTTTNNNGSNDYEIDEEVSTKIYASSEGINEIYSEQPELEYNTVPISTVVKDEERGHRTVAVGVHSTLTAKEAKESYGYESNTSDEEHPLFPTEIISNRIGHSDGSSIITVVNSDNVPVEEMVVEAMFQQAISKFYDSEDRYTSNRDCFKEKLMAQQQVRSESNEEDNNNDSVLVGISSNILAKEEEILCRIALP
jgi:hypothetical protein